MPWSGDAPPFGFGPGRRAVAPATARVGVAHGGATGPDADSTLSLYRRALAIRRTHPALGDGELHWLALGPDAVAFVRPPGLACVVNVSDAPLALPSDMATATVLLGSAGTGAPGVVPGNSAVWLDVGSRSSDDAASPTPATA